MCTWSLRPTRGMRLLNRWRSTRLEKAFELFLIRSGQDQDADAFVRREAHVIQIIPVQRHESTPQLGCETKVLDVGRPAQTIFLDDEQDIPSQPFAHESHEAGRKIRVAVDSRCVAQTFCNGTET